MVGVDCVCIEHAVNNIKLGKSWETRFLNQDRIPQEAFPNKMKTGTENAMFVYRIYYTRKLQLNALSYLYGGQVCVIVLLLMCY